MKKIRLSFFTLLTLTAFGVHAVEPQVGTGETDGFRLVWQDLFDAEELNPLRWEIEVNGAGGGNAELQYYTDSERNVRLGKDEQGNGCLILSAIRENYLGKNFTSGRITSKNRVAFTHGKIEAAIRLPQTANGLWPAFWMMGNDYDQVGWPKCGEIDIMEFGHQDGINNNTQDRYFNGACHWGQGWPAASHAKSITKNYSLQDGEFHLFTLIWDEQSVSMYVDLDKIPVQGPYFKMDIPANEPDNEWSAGNYFHKENFILFNLAVGGNFPGIHDAAGITALNEANGNTASMYVNYVKIYQKGTTDESLFALDKGDIGTSDVDAFESDGFAVRLAGESVELTAPGRVMIYDVTGRLVVSASDVTEYSLGLLPAGMYVVKAVSADGKSASVKFVR